MKKCEIEDSSGKRRLRRVLLTMKLLTILFLAGNVAVSASVYSQATKIDLQLQNSTIGSILKSIESSSDFIFVYDTELVNTKIEKSISLKGANIKTVLDELFGETNVAYMVDDRQVFLYKKDDIKQLDQLKSGTKVAMQKEKELSGIVTDEDGLPLPGVTVVAKGTKRGVVTSIDGKFKLSVPEEVTTLVLSFVGMKTQDVAIGSKSSFNIILEEETVGVDEVVVVGYGVQKKETVTGAIVSIDDKQLVQSPQANISNSLVGRLSGVIAVQRSGQPGEDQTTIRIRGIGTFTGSADPLVLVDGIETDNYNSIDPNEIENISILKDASATAVYGVRGANGVMIITTKRGTEGKTEVSYSLQHATQRFTDFRNTMNAADFANGMNIAAQYDSYITGGYEPIFTDEDIAHFKAHDDPIFHPDVDWFPYMFDKSSGQTQHNLNINGGTEKVKYFVSLGYFDQDGLINHTDLVEDYDATIVFKRYNIRTNFDFEITKRFSANLNLSSTIENRSGTSSKVNEIFEAVWATNPVDQPLITDGKFIELDNKVSLGVSPFQKMFLSGTGYIKDYRNYLNSSLRFNYDLDFVTKGLTSHATISYNNYNKQHIFYRKDLVRYRPVRLEDESIVLIPKTYEAPFGFQETFGKNRKVYFEAGIDYARAFKEHDVNALLLYNQSKRYDPDFLYLVPNGYQGIVGRTTYGYKDKYLAEVNIGYNGTENFAPGKRFGFFPAYSLGWVASEESFFPENKVLTYLKIRGSYGVVGNDKLGSIRISKGGKRFLYMPAAYGYSSNIFQFGEYGSNQQAYEGAIEGALGNENLTWERAKKMNIGADFAFANDKLRGTFDLFKEKRDNILATRNVIPVVVAAQLPAYNLGKMKNSGFEAELSYNDRVGKLDYWLKANYTYAHNVVEYQDEITRPFTYQNRTNQRYGQMFGLKADGFFNTWEEVNDANRPIYEYQNNKIQPGDVKYVDINGDGKINNDDIIPLGYPDFPEVVFGFSLGGNFKGFDFSVLFQGATHVSLAYPSNYWMPFKQGRNAPDYMVESWSQERYDQGLKISFPHFNTGNTTSASNGQRSTLNIEDASYVRLKNAEIGYTIQKKILQKIKIKQVRLYVNGNNLLTWDKLLPGADPESTKSFEAEGYPVTRTINFGFNVKF
nr:TonB-dependent receptor [uncultured Sunxiuqinia sp.]